MKKDRRNVYNQELIIEKYEELEKMMRLTKNIFSKQKYLFEKMMI